MIITEFRENISLMQQEKGAMKGELLEHKKRLLGIKNYKR